MTFFHHHHQRESLWCQEHMNRQELHLPGGVCVCHITCGHKHKLFFEWGIFCVKKGFILHEMANLNTFKWIWHIVVFTCTTAHFLRLFIRVHKTCCFLAIKSRNRVVDLALSLIVWIFFKHPFILHTRFFLSPRVTGSAGAFLHSSPASVTTHPGAGVRCSNLPLCIWHYVCICCDVVKVK